MEIVWQNLQVEKFYKICRLCLANKELELEPLAEQQKNTLLKLTPCIAQLETSAFFPNNICSDCAKQLQKVNEFSFRCNALTNNFHKCIEEYKESVRKDISLPSLEEIFVTTTIKQEVEQTDRENVEETCTAMPITEVFIAENIKKEEFMEFEDTKFIPQQKPSNEYAEMTLETPETSKDEDTTIYNSFMNWRKEKNTESLSEQIVLYYFADLSKKYNTTMLWSIFTMLRTTLKIYNNIDIAWYKKLIIFLKRQSDVYQPKSSNVFKSKKINKFIKESSDKNHLQAKIEIKEDPLARKRRKARERHAKWLAKQSQQSLEKIRAANSAAQRLRREQYTAEQSQARRDADNEAHRRRAEQETAEQYQARRDANTAAQRLCRQRRNLEQCQARRDADAAAHRRRYERETAEQAQARRDANSAAQRFCRKRKTPGAVSEDYHRLRDHKELQM